MRLPPALADGRPDSSFESELRGLPSIAIGNHLGMTNRRKIVSKWIHRRARARALNDQLAALDAPSQLDQLDRPAPAEADDGWTEQKLIRLFDMMVREDTSRAG